MNKFYMNGKMIHKASDHNTKRCEVEKCVFFPHSDFERLKANPYQEHEAITAARDLMYEDKNAYHCIMLLDEYGDDGLLIEAEGFDYPRLSMFVPDAKSIYERYQTSEPELKLHDMIKDTYYLRCKPQPGDYDCYCFCYEREPLEQAMTEDTLRQRSEALYYADC